MADGIAHLVERLLCNPKLLVRVQYRTFQTLLFLFFGVFFAFVSILPVSFFQPLASWTFARFFMITSVHFWFLLLWIHLSTFSFLFHVSQRIKLLCVYPEIKSPPFSCELRLRFDLFSRYEQGIISDGVFVFLSTVIFALIPYYFECPFQGTEIKWAPSISLHQGALAMETKPPCIMSVQYTGGCSVHWGVQYTGGIIEYTGGCSVHWGHIMSTPGDVQYTGVSPGVSIQIQLFSRWPSPTFIMISPWYTHLIFPQCTEHPPVYSWYPSGLLHIPGVLHRHYSGWKRPYIRALQCAMCGCLKKATAMRPSAILFLLHCGAKPQNYGIVLGCFSLLCNPSAISLSRVTFDMERAVSSPLLKLLSLHLAWVRWLLKEKDLVFLTLRCII